MASNIDSVNIDEEFPIAGQDNDSQGFRDNFNTIKTSLATAATEITTLQNDTAKLNESNVFYDNENDTPVNIEKANLKEITQQLYIGGNLDNPVEANQSVSFTNGHYQVFTVGQDVTLVLDDWPASGRLAKLTVELLSSGTRNITFSVAQGGLLKTDGQFANPIQVSSGLDPKIIEFWSWNGGNTVYARYLGEFS